MTLSAESFSTIAFTIFFILNAPGQIPLFLAMLGRFNHKRQLKIIARELTIALILLASFHILWRLDLESSRYFSSGYCSCRRYFALFNLPHDDFPKAARSYRSSHSRTDGDSSSYSCDYRPWRHHHRHDLCARNRASWHGCASCLLRLGSIAHHPSSWLVH